MQYSSQAQQRPAQQRAEASANYRMTSRRGRKLQHRRWFGTKRLFATMTKQLPRLETSKAAALGTVSWAKGLAVVDVALLPDGPM